MVFKAEFYQHKIENRREKKIDTKCSSLTERRRGLLRLPFGIVAKGDAFSDRFFI